MAKEKSSSKLTKLLNVENIPEEQKPKKTLAQIAAQLNSKNPNGNKVTLASAKSGPEVIPSGVLAVDYILGVGGLPRGRMGQIYGAESSYKSTFCLHLIASVQKQGGTAAYIDAERTYDRTWGEKHGIDSDNLLVLEPENSELALNQMTYLINEGVDVIVVDSVVALAPKKEIFDDDKGGAADIEKEAMGVFARKMSQWCRSNIGRIAKNKTLFVFINQLRDNLNAGMFGNPTSVPGGKALKYYSSFMIAARKIGGADGVVKVGNEIVGHKYMFKIDKNKVSRPGREFSFTTYDSILDNYSTLIELAIKDGIIEKVNNITYSYNGETFKGKPGLLKKLYNDENMYDEIKNKLFTNSNIASFDPFEKFKSGTEITVDIPEVEDGEEPEDSEE
jgi:recombination protein RecA